ncbi:MAG: hypothetical protein KBS47_05170 [Bacteroidales bacterium]|nr:hypothetical protein [Candidatus Equimonas enterica]
MAHLQIWALQEKRLLGFGADVDAYCRAFDIQRCFPWTVPIGENALRRAMQPPHISAVYSSQAKNDGSSPILSVSPLLLLHILRAIATFAPASPNEYR